MTDVGIVWEERDLHFGQRFGKLVQPESEMAPVGPSVQGDDVVPCLSGREAHQGCSDRVRAKSQQIDLHQMRVAVQDLLVV